LRLPPQEGWRSGDGMPEERCARHPANLLVRRRVEGERLKGGGVERPKAGGEESLGARHERSDEMTVRFMHPEDLRVLWARPFGAGPLRVAAVGGPGSLTREGTIELLFGVGIPGPKPAIGKLIPIGPETLDGTGAVAEHGHRAEHARDRHLLAGQE